MQYIKGLEKYQDLGRSAVTFGKFDGLHRGHQKLTEKVREFAQREQINSVVCAFDMDFKEQLMTNAERREHLEGQVDYLVSCPFSREFREMHAEEFIREIIKGIFHAEYVVVGTDFRFGYGQAGDALMLQEYAAKYGYETVVIEKERQNGREISSTYIRESMREGKIGLANIMLGYNYGITGVVEYGKQLGRTLGFPTFNVFWPEKKIVPPKGVYLTRTFAEGRWYNSISNVGVKPTVTDEDKVLIESFLFGYEGNAYGKNVTVELLEFRRPEQKFESIKAMKKCIDRDIAYGKSYFGIEK